MITTKLCYTSFAKNISSRLLFWLENEDHWNYLITATDLHFNQTNFLPYLTITVPEWSLFFTSITSNILLSTSLGTNKLSSKRTSYLRGQVSCTDEAEAKVTYVSWVKVWKECMVSCQDSFKQECPWWSTSTYISSEYGRHIHQRLCCLKVNARLYYLVEVNLWTLSSTSTIIYGLLCDMCHVIHSNMYRLL